MAGLCEGDLVKLPFFADDTLVYYSAKNLPFIIRILQGYVRQFEDWFTKWRININTDETQAVIFCKRRVKLPQSISVFRNNINYELSGRNGLGNIYVWASGDGGEDDDCNCDGYAASMWTISINSAINDGQNAHYDESCSSTLASTFSNGAKDPNTGVVKPKLLRPGRDGIKIFIQTINAIV
ncbi:hypothetical protein ANN_23714 [Periplaneta americana]|uniref:Uncharacterized protein n=1 Tax=Periplaneta americana TaxID=6978 RepID=A0ABQ8SMC2_PERAM|nr:hypothetical protein ANN_23714 [Periplaneta americana]